MWLSRYCYMCLVVLALAKDICNGAAEKTLLRGSATITVFGLGLSILLCLRFEFL